MKLVQTQHGIQKNCGLQKPFEESLNGVGERPD